MFGDPLRDSFAPLMEPEVRFALLSRRQDFPITLPECYFADYNRATATGILITERIAYGRGLPRQVPGLQADGPARTLPRADQSLGTSSGFHKAGRFGADIERQFPFDPDKIDAGTRIPYTAS